MNQTLKNQLTKSVLESRLPWIKCLPIALLRIRTAPRKDIGLSPMKCFMGFLTLALLLMCLLLKPDYFLKNCILGLYSTLLFLRKMELLPQAPPLDFPIHPYQPGDYVLIKT
jgi:hypothetical protein